MSLPSSEITVFKGQQTASSELLRQGDLAKYQAKQGGRQSIGCDCPEMNAVSQK